jgi:hypothetical protein
VLGLWPHHVVVVLDLQRRGEACREMTPLVEFRLLCGNGAEERDPEQHAGTMTHHEACTCLNRYIDITG